MFIVIFPCITAAAIAFSLAPRTIAAIVAGSSHKFGSRITSRYRMSALSSSSGAVVAADNMDLVIDPFCVRQFNNPSYTGSQIVYDIVEFERIVNEYYRDGYPLVDGYAPFCKHIFIPNFAGMDCGYVEITPATQPLIESSYEARSNKELPVLVQYIDRRKIVAPKATHLDVILYSREQITEENRAMGTVPPDSTAPWGIISVKGQFGDRELPMQPITIMRNALGVAYGGSGAPLDEAKYADSVEFWRKHVSLK